MNNDINYICDIIKTNMENLNIGINVQKLIEQLKNITSDQRKVYFNTIEKKFVKSKFLADLMLNECGLYIARAIYAEKYVNNIAVKYNFISDSLYTKYKEDGFLIVPNFLPVADFDDLCREVEIVIKNTTLSGTGDCGLHKIFLKKDWSRIQNFYKNQNLIDILKKCSYNPKYCGDEHRQYIEILRHISPDKDIQKTWHVDTFHPTCKWWFYIEDINENQGPLNYIRSSHLNTSKKLEYEHILVNKTLKQLKHGDIGNIEGSLRFYNDEIIKSLGYVQDQYTNMALPKNTLIVVNTRGIHRRGHGKVGAVRVSLASSLRSNIFSIPC